jgi:hypothetical protein
LGIANGLKKVYTWQWKRWRIPQDIAQHINAAVNRSPGPQLKQSAHEPDSAIGSV